MGNVFRRVRPEESERVIVPNTMVELAIDDPTHPNYNFQGNAIKTTKYRWWNYVALDFIPLNLKKQFWINLANIYFLLLLIVNYIPAVGAYSNFISWIPLAIIILTTAVKDFIEDLRRYKSDMKFNSQKCLHFHKLVLF